MDTTADITEIVRLQNKINELKLEKETQMTNIHNISDCNNYIKADKLDDTFVSTQSSQKLIWIKYTKWVIANNFEINTKSANDYILIMCGEKYSASYLKKIRSILQATLRKKNSKSENLLKITRRTSFEQKVFRRSKAQLIYNQKLKELLNDISNDLNHATNIL